MMLAARILSLLVSVAIIVATVSTVEAAGPIEGGGRQALNIPAIAMFFVFVGATLGITYWAAQRTRSAADFYAAGGGITGFQNGLPFPAATCRRRHFRAIPGSFSPPALAV